MVALLVIALILLAVVLVGFALSLRIVKQYDKGLLFRLGRFSRRNGSNGPAVSP